MYLTMTGSYSENWVKGIRENGFKLFGYAISQQRRQPEKKKRIFYASSIKKILSIKKF